MKLMIASDIHGSLYHCRELFRAYEREKACRLILLGDLLYHGPRNDLPREYAPKAVIPLLNSWKGELCCVRGNCDAEVDQAMLEFPILSDSLLLLLENRTVFATHGHVYNEKNLPALRPGDIFLQGHTHLFSAEKRGDYIFLNPGSVSIPRNGNPHSYLIYEDGVFIIRELIEGRDLLQYRLDKSDV